MATATRKAPTKKAKASPKKAAGSKGSRSKPVSIPDTARDMERALSDLLRRELESARKLLGSLEDDVRDLAQRIEQTLDDATGRKSGRTKRKGSTKATAKHESVAKNGSGSKASTKKVATGKAGAKPAGTKKSSSTKVAAKAG